LSRWDTESEGRDAALLAWLESQPSDARPSLDGSDELAPDHDGDDAEQDAIDAAVDAASEGLAVAL
jgi:hypothetical protein